MYNNELSNIDVLTKVMDITTLRHRVLADNLANADTPGFIRSDVSFQDALSSAIESGSEMQLHNIQPLIEYDELTPASPDGNNVLLQKELGGMTENQLLYNFSSRVIKRKFAGLRKAIAGS